VSWQKKNRSFKNRKGEALQPEIVESSIGRYEVIAPVSSVRIGETKKESVRNKSCVDYPKWCTIFVSKDRKECKKWLDRYGKGLVRLCIPYEVSS